MGQFILFSKFDPNEYVTKLCITGESDVLLSNEDSWRCLSITQSTNPLTALFVVYVIVCGVFSFFIYMCDAIVIAMMRIFFHNHHHHHH